MSYRQLLQINLNGDHVKDRYILAIQDVYYGDLCFRWYTMHNVRYSNYQEKLTRHNISTYIAKSHQLAC